MVERSVDSRPKTQVNGAEAPCFSCPETQSWCVIKQKAQHSVRPLPEMRDHTQEKQKISVSELFSFLELSGGQDIFGNDTTQES